MVAPSAWQYTDAYQLKSACIGSSTDPYPCISHVQLSTWTCIRVYSIHWHHRRITLLTDDERRTTNVRHASCPFPRICTASRGDPGVR